MVSSFIFSITIALATPTAPILDDAAIITGYPKSHKIHLYKAKGYDPYIYSGAFPFKGVV